MLADHNVAAKWASQVGSVSEGWRDAGAGRSGAATRAGRTGRAGAVETRADRSVRAIRAGEMAETGVGRGKAVMLADGAAMTASAEETRVDCGLVATQAGSGGGGEGGGSSGRLGASEAEA